MRARNGLKAAGLVAASALLIVVLTAAGLLSFIFYNISAGRDWARPLGAGVRRPDLVGERLHLHR